MPADPTKARVAEGIDRLTWPTGRTTYRAHVPEWTDAAGRRHRVSKTFPTLADARAWRRTQLGDRARGVRKPSGRLDVGTYLAGWIERYGRRAPGNTAARHRFALAKLERLPIWRARLADLEPDDVAAAYDQLAAKDVTYVHDAFHRALADAVPKLVGRNPAAGAMRGRRLQRPERRVWTEDEYQAWLEAARGDECPALWWTLGQTGVRRGELLGLEWPDVDLTDGLVLVRRQFTVVDGRHALKDLKTDYGRRTVALDALTLELLDEWRRLQVSLGARRLGRDSHATFTHLDGRRLAPTKSLQRRFRAIIERAGVRSIGIHDVRHTHATLLLRRGVPVHVVSRRLGHASEGFTLQQYAHVLPDMAKLAADVAGAIAGGHPTSSTTSSPVQAEGPGR